MVLRFAGEDALRSCNQRGLDRGGHEFDASHPFPVRGCAGRLAWAGEIFQGDIGRLGDDRVFVLKRGQQRFD